jgi:hypothetical protein
MTTATNDDIVVEANGLVRVCAWCVPMVRLMEIHRAHRCTDGLCPDCTLRLQEEDR